MADNTQKKRPLIGSGIITEFGEILDDPDAYTAEGGGSPDVTYTPGFSELRQKRDSELALVAKGEMAMRDVTVLPVNVRLSRRTQKNGQPDQTKIQTAGNNGYRPVTKADVGQPWFKELPPGAVEFPDGSIGKGGEVQYMVCDGQRAARNAYRKEQKTLARLGQSKARENLPGVTVTTTQGQPIQAGAQTKID